MVIEFFAVFYVTVAMPTFCKLHLNSFCKLHRVREELNSLLVSGCEEFNPPVRVLCMWVYAMQVFVANVMYCVICMYLCMNYICSSFNIFRSPSIRSYYGSSILFMIRNN